MVIDSFDKGELPVYLQRVFSTQDGRNPQHRPTRKLVAANAKKMPLHYAARAAELVEQPHKAIPIAIHVLGQVDPTQAVWFLTRLSNKGKLSPELRRALVDAISHEKPATRVQNLHIALLAHQDAIGHAAFEQQIAFAHEILNEDYQTFEAINETWNEAMREAADASKKQAERNAIESTQRAHQQQAAHQLANSEKAAKSLNDLIISASLRAKIARLLRRPPTAEKVAWTNASVATTSADGAASSTSAVEEVAYTGADGKTVHAKRTVSVPPAVAAANYARTSVRDALDEPEVASAGVNIGLGMAGYVNRAIAVR